MVNQNHLMEVVSPERNAFLISEKPGEECALDSEVVEAKWQKRVMILLWTSIALLMLLGGVLLYAGYHGLVGSVGSSHDQTAPILRGPPDT